jgi:hypothetical protein
MSFAASAAVVVLVLAGCASGPPGLFHTATPSADQVAAHYRKVVLADISKLSKDDAEVVTACRDQADITACRSAIEWKLIAAEGVQSDLASVTVPPVLDTANKELTTALDLAVRGAQKQLAGIQMDDFSLIVEGVQMTIQSTAHMKRAAMLTQETSA